MVRRFEKKSRYLRGWRTHGWGRVGQHRRHGSKGGRGRAGRHKHEWTWVVKYCPDYFGKHGFKQPPEITPHFKEINVGTIDEKIEEWVREGKAEYRDGKYYVDLLSLGYSKVLGSGKVTKPIVVKAAVFTESAIKKLKEAGGDAIEVRGVVHA